MGKDVPVGPRICSIDTTHASPIVHYDIWYRLNAQHSPIAEIFKFRSDGKFWLWHIIGQDVYLVVIEPGDRQNFLLRMRGPSYVPFLFQLRVQTF